MRFLKQNGSKTNMIIIDTNNALVKACKEAGYDAICADYFLESMKLPRHVLCTASNPRFTFGGGIDAMFFDKFYGYCIYKQTIGGDMQRIGNINFLITVNNDLRATKEMVTKAIKFAKENTHKDEVLCLSGLGTGVGGLSVLDFVDCLNSAGE